MRKHILACVVFAVTGSAAAYDIPKYDVDGRCKSSFKGAAACVKEEQENYDQLKRLWDRVPSTEQESCIRSAGMFGPSYSILRRCAEDALRPEQPAPKFRY